MGTGTKVLVVDDEKGLRAVVQDALEDGGYVTVAAASHDEAVELMTTEAPDVVVSDICLGGRSGFEVASEARQRGIPVLLITGISAPDWLVGFRVLRKPLQLEELLAAVADVFSGRARA